MERQNIFYFFTLLLVLASISANPVPVPKSANTTDQNEEDKEIVVLEEQPTHEDGELLDTANAIVFRPLFAYRRRQAQRRTVYVPRGSYNGGYYYG